jgi:DHA1 family multidrug resistance protein-like MFS transporter
MSTEQSWKVNFIILWIGQFVAIASLKVLVPFLPFYLERIGTIDMRSTLVWSGWALAAPAISYCLVSPLWGKFGDRLGRKWMVIRAMCGLSLSVCLMAIVQTPFQFFRL